VRRIRGHFRAGAALLAALALAATVAACSGDDDDGGSGSSGSDGGGAEEGSDALTVDALTVEVLSSRPEVVSGGDALVAVTVGDDGIDPGDVEVAVGDADVTDAFAPDPDDDTRLVGLVDGLDEGDSTVTARSGDESSELTLTNHPAQGPVFAGEALPLAACTTEAYGLAASAPDDGCVAPTELTWQYVDGDGALHDLADPAQVPADADTVELDDGTTVPFVVRNEWGVINRSIYRITLLDADPASGSDAEADGAPNTDAWNGRLVYRFGGGCGTTFTQGYFGTGEPSVEVLRRGYATATATFNTFQVMCNDLLSAETMSMVKEHFVETYGLPVHTIGEGGSGGAIQQLLIAQNYPGLLDAVVPTVPFPDALSIGGGVFDCALLTNYYGTPAGRQLTPEQRAAINGHGVAGTCDLWNASFATNIDPVRACSFDVAAVFGAGGTTAFPSVPPDEIYDAETNPDGWRCDVWESNVAITGRDPDTGYANSGYDNEGIQYGLDALNAGTITPDQFVDLNAGIGGFDIDGQPQPERSVVSDELAERAYTSGRVTGPYGGLPDTPIILVNVYTDMQGDIHDRVRSFEMMDRLADEDGDVPATVSLWTVGADPGGGIAATLTGALGDFASGPTFVMDEWLTAAEAHQADEGGSWRDALAAAKPDDAESRCTVDGEEIVGPDANEDERCAEAYPIHEEPRMAAGMPRRGDLLKCSRIDVAEAAESGVYEVELSDAQLDRLAEIFPTGVCDYTRPAIGQSEPDGVWQSFTD
jgi:hypothetical protein